MKRAVVLASLLHVVLSVELRIHGLFPVTGEWTGGGSLLTAVEMAIEHVNAMPNILPGYNLTLTWDNTQCNPGLGVKQMTDSLYQEPQKIAIIGGACSMVSQATAEVSHLWNITQLSYASSSPSLSQKSRFPKFVRLCSVDTALTSVRTRIFKQLGWTRIASIYQSLDIFSLANDDLVEKLAKMNITLLTSQIFSEDPIKQVHRLKEKDARIIVGSFYPEKGRIIFCESYKLGMIHPRVVWLLPGWLTKYWWKDPDPELQCSPQQMDMAVEGIIYSDFVYLSPDNKPSVTGLTPSVFTANHQKRNRLLNRHKDGSLLASQGYDVILTLAMGLNATLTKLRESGSEKRLESFTYGDGDFGDLIYNSTVGVEFQGLKGLIKFDDNGDAYTILNVEQIQNGHRKLITTVPMDDDSPLNFSRDDWKDGKIPLDGPLTYSVHMHQSPILHGFMCACAALGIITSVGFLTFNIRYKEIKFIKLSSPRLNNVLLVGCIITYITVFVGAVTPSVACPIGKYPLVIGWCLIFGSLFSKTWRVHQIFTNVKLQKKVLKDTHLFVMVGSLTTFYLLLLIGWSVFDPLYTTWQEMYTENRELQDSIVVFLGPVCDSRYRLYLDWVIFGLQALLLLIGGFLAWETRNVKVEALNDSKNITLCIYNSVILGIMYIIIKFALTLSPDINYGLNSAIAITTATVSQCILFVPKIRQFRNHQLQPENGCALPIGTSNKNRLKAPEPSTQSSLDSQQSELYETKLKQKEEEIAKLKEQIEQMKLLVAGDINTNCSELGNNPSTDQTNEACAFTS